MKIKKNIRIWPVLMLIFALGACLSCELDEKEFIRPVPMVAEPVGVTEVSFVARWNAVLGAESYYVDVATDAEFGRILDGYNNRLATDTFLLVEGLAVSTPYFYRVRFERNQINSDNSQPAALQTQGFGRPVAMEASGVQLTGFTACWRAVQGAAGYTLELSDEPSFGRLLASVKTVDSCYVFADLKLAQTYYYRVRAVSGEVVSEVSNVITVATQELDAVSALSASKVEAFGFVANWEVLADADSYVVELARNGDFSGDVLRLAASGSQYLFEDLVPNNLYAYRVFAKRDGVVAQRASGVIWVRTLPLEQAVPKEAKKRHAFGFTASWDLVPDATSYVVRVATDAAFTQVVHAWLETTGTELEIDGLKHDEVYYYRVLVRHLDLYSAWSEPVLVEPIIKQCRLERMQAKWFPDNYDVQLRYNTENLLVSFSENRKDTDDDRFFRVQYDADGKVKQVDVHQGLEAGTLLESWQVNKREAGLLKEWLVTDADGKLIKMRRLTHANNRLEKYVDYADLEATTVTASWTVEYYGEDVPWAIFLDGTRERHFQPTANTLNPMNLIDADLLLFIRSERGTSYPVASEKCFGFEVVTDPYYHELGFFYETTFVGLPTLSFSNVAVNYVYNEGCPID